MVFVDSLIFIYIEFFNIYVVSVMFLMIKNAFLRYDVYAPEKKKYICVICDVIYCS